MIDKLLHEQYETTDGHPVLFRCTECGYRSQSLGSLHAHCEKHRGLFGFQLPWRYGDFDALMELTEVVRVKETDEIGIEEVKGL